MFVKVKKHCLYQRCSWTKRPSIFGFKRNMAYAYFHPLGSQYLQVSGEMYLFHNLSYAVLGPDKTETRKY